MRGKLAQFPRITGCLSHRHRIFLNSAYEQKYGRTETMALMISKLYNALREAGASDLKAREAA